MHRRAALRDYVPFPEGEGDFCLRHGDHVVAERRARRAGSKGAPVETGDDRLRAREKGIKVGDEDIFGRRGSTRNRVEIVVAAMVRNRVDGTASGHDRAQTARVQPRSPQRRCHRFFHTLGAIERLGAIHRQGPDSVSADVDGNERPLLGGERSRDWERWRRFLPSLLGQDSVGHRHNRRAVEEERRWEFELEFRGEALDEIRGRERVESSFQERHIQADSRPHGTFDEAGNEILNRQRQGRHDRRYERRDDGRRRRRSGGDRAGSLGRSR